MMVPFTGLNLLPRLCASSVCDAHFHYSCGVRLVALYYAICLCLFFAKYHLCIYQLHLNLICPFTVTMSMFLHVVQEYARKEVEHARAASDLRENYAVQCRKMGIEVTSTAD